VVSLIHVNALPVWLQFGGTSNVYLYLSQKATVAEESWLKIVNHVKKLLVDYVNQIIKEIFGRNTPSGQTPATPHILRLSQVYRTPSNGQNILVPQK
jgi:hypothetical protein